jgi:hypothetical protein
LSFTPVLFVVEIVDRSTLAPLPEFRCRRRPPFELCLVFTVGEQSLLLG